MYIIRYIYNIASPENNEYRLGDPSCRGLPSFCTVIVFKARSVAYLCIYIIYIYICICMHKYVYKAAQRKYGKYLVTERPRTDIIFLGIFDWAILTNLDILAKLMCLDAPVSHIYTYIYVCV